MNVKQVLIVGLALGMATTGMAQQRNRSTVQLEAADCSRSWSQFGDRQVARAVQHEVAPVSSTALDVRPGGNGGVRIEPGTGSTFSITACIAAGADTLDEAQRAVQQVKLSVEGNRVRVVEGTGTARSWSVQLIVETPRGAQIDIETSNGPIGIRGVEASITARAANGPIGVDDASGSLRAVAVNGPISVSGSRGNFDVQTQNGPISVRLQGTRWEGALQARANNGPLSVVVPDDYGSGVEITSSGRSPWNCRIAACGSQAQPWDREREDRTLRIGPEPVAVQISTRNGPVTIDRAR